jgi:Cu/Ag efflux protein CusF
MKPFAVILTAAALVAAPQLYAQQPGGTVETTSTRPGGATATQTTKVTADVVSINPAAREIVLRQPNGEIAELVVGEDVKNLEQVRVGDRVTAEYRQALSLDLKKGAAGIREQTESQSGSLAQAGQKPGGAVQREVTILADVTAVDRDTQTVALRGPRGNTVKLKVQDPDQLAKVKKGDQVQAVYTEALAINVQREARSYGSSTPGASQSSGPAGSSSSSGDISTPPSTPAPGK